MHDVDLNQYGKFTDVYNFTVNVIKDCISFLDHIKIGNFSLLDLSLAILAIGLIITVTLSTVSNFAAQGMTASENIKDRKQREREKEYIRKDRERAKNEVEH